MKRKLAVDAARQKERESAAERYKERKAVEALSTGVSSLPSNNLPLSDRQHNQIASLSARPGAGVTQSDIAHSIGCAQSTVSRSIRGVTYSSGNPVGRPRLTTPFEREEVRKVSRRDPFGRLKNQKPKKKQAPTPVELEQATQPPLAGQVVTQPTRPGRRTQKEANNSILAEVGRPELPGWEELEAQGREFRALEQAQALRSEDDLSDSDLEGEIWGFT